MMIAAGIGISWVFAGCDLFETREAQTPGGSGATFTDPTDPDIAIANLKNAVREKNAENYRRCLADEAAGVGKVFQFEPTLAAQSAFQTEFSGWTIASEVQYFRNLVAAAETGGRSSLDLFEQSMNRSQDSALFNAKYHLVFQHTDASLPDEARGRLEFSLIRNTQNSWWYIYRWVDYPDTAQTTWSDFKGTFFRGG